MKRKTIARCRLFRRIGRLSATEAEKTEGTLSLVKEAQTEKEET